MTLGYGYTNVTVTVPGTSCCNAKVVDIAQASSSPENLQVCDQSVHLGGTLSQVISHCVSRYRSRSSEANEVVDEVDEVYH